MTLSIVAKDGSKPLVSCLNFEPRVSKFPVLEVEVTSNTTVTMISHCPLSKGVSCRIFIEKVFNRIVFFFFN